MLLKNRTQFICLFILVATIFRAGAQSIPQPDENSHTLETGLQLLDRYFRPGRTWHATHPETKASVQELIRFIERKPLDSTLTVIHKNLNDSTYRFVYRLPEYVHDSLKVPGFYAHQTLQNRIEKINSQLYEKYFQEELAVPVSLISNLEEQAGVIPPGEGYKLFEANIYRLPDTLQLAEVIPDSLIQSPNDFKRFLRRDSIRKSYIEEKRLAYNDSVLIAYRDSIIENYRRRQYEQEFSARRQRLSDSVKQNNYHVLKRYNDQIVQAVNDSISFVLKELAAYADLMDTTRFTITNLRGDEYAMLLQNNNPYYSRFWLKNEQNDSLRLMIKSIDKRSMQMLIDDGATISRFRPRQTKDFDFKTLQRGVSGLTGVSERYQVFTPWVLGGDGSVGFTQTYLENWKKGGQSALALQIILKGFANYSRSDGKVKWENSGEIRNGYIRPGGDDAELQKNDDKFEITSRLGVSAFKKWYYSSEFNYETQFFNGYKYPTSKNPKPISAFMSPARTFFKLGLDYKPNKNFSLFLSPLTAKNVFVKDTVKINPVNFGIEKGKRGEWEPGLNADLFYRKSLTPDLTWTTKYKMFINYIHPLGNLDFNWENLFVMKLTDHINMQMLVHLIYDEKILFPVLDENGKATGEKEPKLQVREFITVGFSYKINRQVTRTRLK